jgi:glycosyltransferase involved in cell wall biosynthesis
MVAAWNQVKRHHVLLKALREIGDPTYRVALVGYQWDLSREDIEAMADYYGVRENVVIFQDLDRPSVNEILNKSKVNLLLSLREGANKSIFEGFFADVPGIVLKNNLGVNKSYINAQTGRLIEEKELAATLQWFRSEYKRFHPRAWAEANISCRVTTRKLEEVLKEISRKLGEPWTRPLAVRIKLGYYQEYYDAAEGLEPVNMDKYRRR